MSPETKNSVKLSRYISLAGIGSRRKAEVMIGEGRVGVNGAPVTNVATRVNCDTDRITVDGVRIHLPIRFTYIILNKPAGFICSTVSSKNYRSIYTLLPGTGTSRLKYAGRLDVDSEGLVLLTDDGELIFRLTHPRHKQGKRYLVKTRGVPDPASIRKLAAGIRLDDGVTKPCRVRLQRTLKSGAWFQIELFEGRKRQLRRMFEAIGYGVERLRRIGIGPILLGTLSRGEVRVLREKEVSLLLKSAGLFGTRSR